MWRVLRVLPPAAAALVVSVACVDLLGWLIGIEALIRVVPGAAIMTPSSALGLLLAGTGLWLLRKEGAATTRGGKLGRALGVVVALFGLLTLVEYVFTTDLGIDLILFPERVRMFDVRFPGRPSPVSAASFLLTGLALLLLDVRTRRGWQPAPVPAILAGFTTIQTLTGYGFREPTLFTPEPVIAGVPTFTPMAIHTAAAFLILSLGILSARPRHGVVALFTGEDAGGLTARRLLPAAILVPLVLGWLLLAGEQAGLFGIVFGTSLLVVVTMVALALLIGWNSAILRRLDLERRAAEEAQRFLAEASRALSGTLEFDGVLRTVAERAVPARADICVIDLVGEAEAWRRTLVHADPARQALLEELRRLLPIGEARPGVPEVLRTGRAVLVPEISDRLRRDASRDREHYRILRELGGRSLMIVPLRARGRVIGAMSLVRAGPGEPYGDQDLSVAQDLADRAALALENARLYREARQATRVRDEVLRIVAHDLRNPLNTIALTAGLLRERLRPEPSPEARGLLDIIGRSVEGANRLIQDLLDVARLEAGRLPLEPAAVEAAALVREAVELQRVLAGQKALRLEVHVPDRLPEILADRGRVLQVFSNLIGNAIKFTPEGGRITVEAVRSEEAVSFCVTDTGPGIPAEDVPHLFDPFWQAAAATTVGAGLGLPIARGIVEAHGGRIWVRTASGAGTTFCFTIPVAHAGEAGGERAAA